MKMEKKKKNEEEGKSEQEDEEIRKNGLGKKGQEKPNEKGRGGEGRPRGGG